MYSSLFFTVSFAVVLFQTPVSGYGVGMASPQNAFSPGSRVIGGRPAVPGEFPYQLQLRLSGYGLICGATLVPSSGKQVAITAGHCVTEDPSMPTYPKEMFEVRAGVIGLEEEGEGLSIREIVVHPDYHNTNDGVPVNDIAVLILDGEFTLTENVKPLDLPQPGQVIKDKVILSGWGRTSTQSEASADTLQTVELPMVDSTTCNNWYSQGQPIKVIFDTMFCAGTEKGEIIGCNGDSGGPAMGGANEQQPYLAGVASFVGSNCEKYPTVFTRVSSYLDWIAEVTS